MAPATSVIATGNGLVSVRATPSRYPYGHAESQG